jgi:hypothetical protein
VDGHRRSLAGDHEARGPSASVRVRPGRSESDPVPRFATGVLTDPTDSGQFGASSGRACRMCTRAQIGRSASRAPEPGAVVVAICGRCDWGDPHPAPRHTLPPPRPSPSGYRPHRYSGD